jgi:putative Ca2+/H+ antiporter (TMEM165/GDT1 family)
VLAVSGRFLRKAPVDPLASASVFGGLTAAAMTFGLVFLAEMGDKTQLAVAGLAGTLPAIPVWIGATLALGSTSALGVVVGRKLLRRIPLHRLHQISGAFFLILAAFALTKVFAD